MKETKIPLHPREIEYNGEKFLGIPTGVTGKSFSLTKILQMKQNPGWIVREDSVSEWKITGFCKIENSIFLYGPAVEGITLEQLLSRPMDQFLPSLYTLINALITLKNKSIPLYRMSTHSVFILADGGILFLPPDIFMELMDLRSFKDKREVYSMYNHPDRTNEDNLSFSLGVLLYKAITGTFPYPSETEEEIHHMMRELSIPSPRSVRPGLKDRVVNILESSLKNTGRHTPGLELWKAEVKAWMESGLEQDMTDEEIRIIKTSEEQKKLKAARTFKFKVFWYQNYLKIAVISGIIIFLGIIVGFTIKNMFFRVRNIAGMSPEEVTMTYFDSINKLDYFTVDDCLLGDAGKDEAQTVMNLYVITRQRSAYEQGPSFISAKEWDDKGRPEIDAFIPMYGVTDVQILKQEYNPAPVITVSYEKWATETENMDEEYMTGKVIYFGFYIKERLYFKQDRGDWVIFQIEVLEKRKIS